MSVALSTTAALLKFVAAATMTGIVAANFYSSFLARRGVVLDVTIDIEPLTILFYKTTDFVQLTYIFLRQKSCLEFDHTFAVIFHPFFRMDNMKAAPFGDGGRVDSIGSGRGVP